MSQYLHKGACLAIDVLTGIIGLGSVALIIWLLL